MSNASSVLGDLRRPEYTGENRCLLCTAVNVAIAIVVSAASALVWLPLGAGLFAVALLAIYFRGYLVPGTPTLTKRYLPDAVLAYSEHGDVTPVADPAAEAEWETLDKLEYERANAVDPDAFLLDAGVIQEDASTSVHPSTELTVTDRFEAAVAERISQLEADGVTRETLADVFETTPDSITFKDRDYPAIGVDARVRPWPSEGALHADVAAHEVISAWSEEWQDVPIEQRLDALEALRSFHERCPSCGGAIEFDDTVVESCCRSFEVVDFECTDCGEPLVELPPDAVGGDPLADARRPGASVQIE